MKFVALIGRILFSIIFIFSGASHFSPDTISYAAQQGLPLVAILVPLSGIMAIVGGLCILVGYKARFGAWLIVIFLVPVTLLMHAFWKIVDPVEGMIEQIMFFKNLSILGGALLIAYFGSGPLSLEHSQNDRPLT